jgi:hypothetical protein
MILVGFDMVLIWFGYGVGYVLILFWYVLVHGFGIVLVLFWYGLVWFWYCCGMALV